MKIETVAVIVGDNRVLLLLKGKAMSVTIVLVATIFGPSVSQSYF